MKSGCFLLAVAVLLVFLEATSGRPCRPQLKILSLDNYKSLASVPGGLQNYLSEHKEDAETKENCEGKLDCTEFVCGSSYTHKIFIGSGCYAYFSQLCEDEVLDYKSMMQEAFKTAPTFQHDTGDLFLYACRDHLNCDTYRSDEDTAVAEIPMVLKLIRRLPNISPEDAAIVPLPPLTSSTSSSSTTSTSTESPSTTSSSSSTSTTSTSTTEVPTSSSSTSTTSTTTTEVPEESFTSTSTSTTTTEASSDDVIPADIVTTEHSLNDSDYQTSPPVIKPMTRCPVTYQELTHEEFRAKEYDQRPFISIGYDKKNSCETCADYTCHSGNTIISGAGCLDDFFDNCKIPQSKQDLIRAKDITVFAEAAEDYLLYACTGLLRGLPCIEGAESSKVFSKDNPEYVKFIKKALSYNEPSDPLPPAKPLITTQPSSDDVMPDDYSTDPHSPLDLLSGCPHTFVNYTFEKISTLKYDLLGFSHHSVGAKIQTCGKYCVDFTCLHHDGVVSSGAGCLEEFYHPCNIGKNEQLKLESTLKSSGKSALVTENYLVYVYEKFTMGLEKESKKFFNLDNPTYTKFIRKAFHIREVRLKKVPRLQSATSGKNNVKIIGPILFVLMFLFI